jgi:hypothetical protein
MQQEHNIKYMLEEDLELKSIGIYFVVVKNHFELKKFHRKEFPLAGSVYRFFLLLYLMVERAQLYGPKSLLFSCTKCNLFYV